MLAFETVDSDYFMVVSSSDQALISWIGQDIHTLSNCFKGVIDCFSTIIVVPIDGINNESLCVVQRRNDKEGKYNYSIAIHFNTAED